VYPGGRVTDQLYKGFLEFLLPSCMCLDDAVATTCSSCCHPGKQLVKLKFLKVEVTKLPIQCTHFVIHQKISNPLSHCQTNTCYQLSVSFSRYHPRTRGQTMRTFQQCYALSHRILSHVFRHITIPLNLLLLSLIVLSSSSSSFEVLLQKGSKLTPTVVYNCTYTTRKG
jgi:hypothetical protein